MNIIRKIKLNSLGNYQFTDKEKEIVEIIENNFKNLIIENNDYKNNIDIVFSYNEYYLYVTSKYWELLENISSYIETESIIKDICLYYYKFIPKQILITSEFTIVTGRVGFKVWSDGIWKEI